MQVMGRGWWGGGGKGGRREEERGGEGRELLNRDSNNLYSAQCPLGTDKCRHFLVKWAISFREEDAIIRPVYSEPELHSGNEPVTSVSKITLWLLVRKRTIPNERPPLVNEI
jgi:hypothetical protein